MGRKSHRDHIAGVVTKLAENKLSFAGAIDELEELLNQIKARRKEEADLSDILKRAMEYSEDPEKCCKACRFCEAREDGMGGSLWYFCKHNPLTELLVNENARCKFFKSSEEDG